MSSPPAPAGEVRIARTADLAAPLAVRMAVFVGEQGVSEAEEIDGKDECCLHWLAIDAVGPVATLRVQREGEVAKIGRVAVLPRARGQGIGLALMEAAMEALRAEGVAGVTLGAQLSAMGFYERLGFAAHGPVYEDAGIPHRDMSRLL